MAEKQTKNTKQIGKYIRMGILAVLVILLAIMPLLASRKQAASGPKASILTGVVELRDIHTQLSGGGKLNSNASLNIRIPAEVKLVRYLVGNGDTVLEGDPIAEVDKVSVMTAITGVQETLDHLSGEISSASYNNASNVVKALSGGRVKIVYARPGDEVKDVMMKHGALAVLSLDNTMAVEIYRDTELYVGNKVYVAFPDGREVGGKVKSNVQGHLVVIIDDNNYAVGETVTILNEDGDRLGSGELYIHNPWNATAYTGTVKTVYAQENTTFYAGQYLFYLENTGKTSDFQELIDQRVEYEALMQSLFTMYQTGTLNAPCDGVVSGVDDEGAFLLSGSGKGWVARLLSHWTDSREDSFVACAVRVTQITQQGMLLAADPNVTTISDLTLVSHVAADPAAMTAQWNYLGDAKVYTQGADGLLNSDGNAQVGDILIALGDRNGVKWFVRWNGTSVLQSAAEQRAENQWAVRLSDVDGVEPISEVPPTPVCLGSAGCTLDATASGHQSGCVNYQAPAPGVCNGSAGCTLDATASGHQSGCVNYQAPAPGVCNGSAGCTLDASASGHQSGCVHYQVPAPGTCNGSAGCTLAPGEPGHIEGCPNHTGSGATATLKAYVASVVAVDTSNGILMVSQDNGHNITNMGEISALTANPAEMINSKTYNTSLLTGISAGDTVVVVVLVSAEDSVILVQKLNSQGSGGQGGMSMGGQGGMPSGGGASAAPAFTLYSLEEVTVAAVTSQEHMALPITVDELEITSVYVGQHAVVTVDALGGVEFDAEVNSIAYSGENEGGNSKFTVELALARSGEMLPGMYASAEIPLKTDSQVPSVPVAALAQNDTDTVIYTGYDQEEKILINPVVVKTGVSDGENVRILMGLELGQTFYYSYYDTYADSDEPQQSGFSMMGR